MEKDFLAEMNFEGVTNYVVPLIITLSGVPGSGKTELAYKLSNSLGIYLLSNDYVRN